MGDVFGPGAVTAHSLTAFADATGTQLEEVDFATHDGAGWVTMKWLSVDGGAGAAATASAGYLNFPDGGNAFAYDGAADRMIFDYTGGALQLGDDGNVSTIVNGGTTVVRAKTGGTVALKVQAATILTASATAVTVSQPTTVSRDAIATTVTAAVIADNATAALVGTPVQYGPSHRSAGAAWDTDDTTSRAITVGWHAMPVSAASCFGRFVAGYTVAGGAFTEIFRASPGRDGADTVGNNSLRLGASAIQVAALDAANNMYLGGSSAASCYANSAGTTALQSGGTTIFSVLRTGGVDKLGFYGTAAQAKPTIAGAKADAVAASILSALTTLGLVTDSTT